MPSRQEGFGLVYAEAMWHGLPCVGSTADAAAEVIRDGVTGVHVTYADVPGICEVRSSLCSAIRTVEGGWETLAWRKRVPGLLTDGSAPTS